MYYTPEQISKAIAALEKKICCQSTPITSIQGLSQYDDNTDATGNGLVPGDLYYTLDGDSAILKIVVEIL